MGSVQVRSVMFMTGLFVFRYGQLMLMACLEVEFWYLTKKGTESSSRQDAKSIGQDGKCNLQAIEIHDRTVSRWVEPQSGYGVMVGW